MPGADGVRSSSDERTNEVKVTNRQSQRHGLLKPTANNDDEDDEDDDDDNGKIHGDGGDDDDDDKK